MIKSFQI